MHNTFSLNLLHIGFRKYRVVVHDALEGLVFYPVMRREPATFLFESMGKDLDFVDDLIVYGR